MKSNELKQWDSIVVRNYEEVELLSQYLDKLWCKWITWESYLNNMWRPVWLEIRWEHHYFINKWTHSDWPNYKWKSYFFTDIDFWIDIKWDECWFKMYDRVIISEYDWEIQKWIIVHKHPSFDDKYVVEIIGESPYGHYDTPLAYTSKWSGKYWFISTKHIKIDKEQELQSYDWICAWLSVPLIDYGLSFSDCWVSSWAYSAVTGVSWTDKDWIDVEYVQSKYWIDLYPDIGEIIPKIKSNSRYPKNPYIY